MFNCVQFWIQCCLFCFTVAQEASRTHPGCRPFFTDTTLAQITMLRGEYCAGAVLIAKVVKLLLSFLKWASQVIATMSGYPSAVPLPPVKGSWLLAKCLNPACVGRGATWDLRVCPADVLAGSSIWKSGMLELSNPQQIDKLKSITSVMPKMFVGF